MANHSVPFQGIVDACEERKAFMAALSAQSREELRDRVEQGRERAAEVARLLAGFKGGDRERAAERGEGVAQNRERVAETRRLLFSFKAEHAETARAWREVIARVRAMKAGVTASPSPLGTEEAPSDMAGDEMAEEPALRGQLFALIDSHPQGIKLVDIEKASGAARIKVATECRRLIVEGRVRKEGPLYIPVR